MRLGFELLLAYTHSFKHKLDLSHLSSLHYTQSPQQQTMKVSMYTVYPPTFTFVLTHTHTFVLTPTLTLTHVYHHILTIAHSCLSHTFCFKSASVIFSTNLTALVTQSPNCSYMKQSYKGTHTHTHTTAVSTQHYPNNCDSLS